MTIRDHRRHGSGDNRDINIRRRSPELQLEGLGVPYRLEVKQFSPQVGRTGWLLGFRAVCDPIYEQGKAATYPDPKD
jgi:hypothetical protein